MGPVLMQQLNIGPKQLGYLVSAYTFSAAVVGLLSAMIIDRFDRRKALLVMLVAMALSELACAFSPSYDVLFIFRMTCGACAGVIGGLLNTIIGDAIAPERRGKAFGQVMSAFAFASVAGVPIGLYFASQFGWHAPFVIVIICLSFALLAAWQLVPSLRDHLTVASVTQRPTGLAGLINPIKQVLTVAAHRRAYLLVILVVGSSFLVIPFISVYTVANVHLPAKQLSLVYFIGGAMALLASGLIGRLTDQIGTQKTFTYLNCAAIVSVLVTTNMVPAPLVVVLLVSTFFFIVVPTRMVPAMAMVNAAVTPQLRGTFMSLNSALQSTVQGVTALIAASIIGRNSANELERYGWVGALSALFVLMAIFWSYRMQTSSNSQTQ